MQEHAGDGRGGLGVVDREGHDAEDGDVLGEARADVGHRLGGGVDRESPAGLDQVGQQRGAAADDAEDGLVERGRVTGQQHADHGAGGGADGGGDRVPRGVDVGDLVGDELHRVEEPGDGEHVPAREHVGDLGEVVDPVGDAQHEHDQIGVDAAGPAAGEDERE